MNSEEQDIYFEHTEFSRDGKWLVQTFASQDTFVLNVNLDAQIYVTILLLF